MSRRAGEAILIGDDVEIVITQIGRSRVRIGIRAPKHVQVIAREVKLVQDENVVAASVPEVSCLDTIVARLQPEVSQR